MTSANTLKQSHLYQAELLEEDHEAVKEDNQEIIEITEEEIGELAAQIWGLFKEVLKDVSLSEKRIG